MDKPKSKNKPKKIKYKVIRFHNPTNTPIIPPLNEYEKRRRKKQLIHNNKFLQPLSKMREAMPPDNAPLFTKPPTLTEVEAKLKADIKRLNTIKCEESLAEFTKQAWHIIEPATPLIWNWHLDTLCAYLEATTLSRMNQNRITRLIINVPPGSLKSILVSVMFPAWLWIKQPDKRLLGVSNAQDLAIRDSRRTKQIITDPWYTERWPLELKEDQTAKTNYENKAGGFRVSLGITANITGKRGDYILIDDPHDSTSVQSDLIRQSVLDAYDTKLSTRVNSQRDSVIILVMQRLHASDLTGHLLSKLKTKWVHVVMPMHYDPSYTYDARKHLGKPELNDPRKEDELLFPEIFPQSVVEKLEEDLGEYACTPGHTPILMADGSTKPIKDVKVGDWVIGYKFTEEGLKKYRRANATIQRRNERGKKKPGYVNQAKLHRTCEFTKVRTKVTKVFKYENSPVYRYDMDSGKFLECTKDHKWFRPKSNSQGIETYLPMNIECVPGKKKKIQYYDPLSVRFKDSGPIPTLSRIKDDKYNTEDSKPTFFRCIGLQDVYALTTGTGNYVAWGHVSSNSAGQLEQRPSPKGGGILRQSWFRVLDESGGLPHCEHIFISCDTAYSEKDMKSNSYSAFTTWGVFWNKAQQRDCILLLDVWYDQVDYPELRRKVKEMDRQKKPDIWLIEKKASGQCYDDQTQVLTDWGWKFFKDVDIDADKFATLDPVTQEVKWQYATAEVNEPYDGRMYSFGGPGLLMVVTPNHRMLVYKDWPNSKELEFITAEEVYQRLLRDQKSFLPKALRSPAKPYHGENGKPIFDMSVADFPGVISSASVMEKYRGDTIHCVQVPNGTLCVRRDYSNGRPMWCGNSLVQDLRQAGIMVRTYVPTTDKVSRAYAVQPMLESGQVWIPDRKWAHAFAYKMGTFPTGDPASFDLADTCTQALLYIRNGLYVSHPDDEEYKPIDANYTSVYGSRITELDMDEEDKPKGLVHDDDDVWGGELD